MNEVAFLLLSFVAAAAVGDWIAVLRGSRPLEYLCKPLVMVALVAAALAVDPVDQTVRTWFVVALMLSLVGDVYLMLPRDLFVYGLTAFLAAHVAYIGGMAHQELPPARLVVGSLVAVALLAAVGSRIALGARRREPAMAGPVVLYMVVIAAMLAVAVGTGRPAAMAGAALFVASDALIGWSRFARPAVPGPETGDVDPTGSGRLRLAIMVTYHLGQVGLVLSLVPAGPWVLVGALLVAGAALLALLEVL